MASWPAAFSAMDPETSSTNKTSRASASGIPKNSVTGAFWSGTTAVSTVARPCTRTSARASTDTRKGIPRGARNEHAASSDIMTSEQERMNPLPR